MKCKISLIIVFSLLSFGMRAQSFGNEWLDPSRTYFKFSIEGQKVIRLSYEALQQAGFNVNAASPARFQIWHMGKQLPRKVVGVADGSFDPGDYIEFVGVKNTGQLDSALYHRKPYQLQDEYGLYETTSYYFFTEGISAGLPMQTFYENNPSLPQQTFAYVTQSINYKSWFTPGQGLFGNGSQFHFSEFESGEGFCSSDIFQQGQQRTTTFTTQHFINQGQPKASALVCGRNKWQHTVQLLAGPNAGALSLYGSTHEFNQYRSKKVTENIPLSAFGTNQISIGIRAVGGATTTEHRVSLATLKITYPVSFNLSGIENRLYEFENPVANKFRIVFTSGSNNTMFYDVSNPYEPRQLSSLSVAGGLQQTVVVDNFGSGGQILTAITFHNVVAGNLQQRQYRIISPAQSNKLAVFVSHPKLAKPSANYNNPVQAYLQYRKSPAGGGYDTLHLSTYYIEDAFAYGYRHPIGLRNFARFLRSGGNSPASLFILGKGLVVYETLNLSPAEFENLNLVPIMGNPPSDNWITLGLENKGEIAFPVGRLPAFTPQHVENYLNKIKEHELQTEKQLWRKRALHGSGGRSVTEFNNFQQNIANYSDVFESPYMGGVATKISKDNNSAVQVFDISDLVNDGLSIVTFFGHSSALGSDIEIGYVTDPVYNYTNKGKYPFIYINGCYSGNMYIGLESFLQNWILTKDKGSIASFAHCDLGTSGPLNELTLSFYDVAFTSDNYFGQPLGQVIKQAFKDYITTTSATPVDSIMLEQMVYSGDPLTFLYSPQKPDYQISQSEVFFPEQTNIDDAGFNLRLGVTNFGKYVTDSVDVFIKRSFGGQTQTIGPILFGAVAYRDTFDIYIENPDNITPGEHSFDIYIDYRDTIPELDETNNYASVNLLFNQSGVEPLQPVKYSIVNTAQIQFLGRKGNEPLQNQSYKIEIDTTPGFNSPQYRQRTFNGTNLPTVSFDINPNLDSTVWYWRIIDVNASNVDLETARSSFIYINNSPEGWNQSHFPQFNKTTTQAVVRNDLARTWDFPLNQHFIEVQTASSMHPAATDSFYIRYDGIPIYSGGNVCHLDPNGNPTSRLFSLSLRNQTLDPFLYPYTNDPFKLRDYTCGRNPRWVNFYPANAWPIPGYFNFLEKGDYYILTSFGNVPYNQWPGAAMAELANLGANMAEVNNLQQGENFIIVGRKGDSKPIFEAYPKSNTTTPRNAQIIGPFKQALNQQVKNGLIESPIIGPARNWKQLFFEFLTPNASDLYKLQVIGIDLQGNQTLQIADVPVSGLSLNSIDAEKYPYLKLKATLIDSVNYTAPQLRMWRVIYDGVPEGIVNNGLVSQTDFNPPDAVEGDTVQFRLAFQNISSKSFAQPIKVVFELFNNQSGAQVLRTDTLTYSPLQAFDTLFFNSPAYSTIGLAGQNRVQVFVNPYLQPEENYTNNREQVTFNVNSDQTNPVLQVTFDGRKILDGEIVAPQPNILITLKDENNKLLKTDTTGIKLLLKKPCAGCVFESVPLSSPDVRWEPQTPETDFTIQYLPQFEQDGVYKLRVQGQDASANLSGVFEYIISFEVVSESSVTNIFPYPNPFSTNCRFVFTLTGNQVPDQLHLQIMTITGRVVKDFYLEDLGPIHIGNNITDVAWDGTDQYGNQLANGVYLYRVDVRQNGQSVKHRGTAADKFFNNGIGKIYIMR